MYLLDTNVVSELRKPKPHGAVLQWVQAVADADLHLSAVTIGEIQASIEITRKQDTAKAAELERWLERVTQACNVLPMDAATFRQWARLMHKASDTRTAAYWLKPSMSAHGGRRAVFSRGMAPLRISILCTARGPPAEPA